MVSESGASIYSASELAAREYPDLDVTVRGAISIAHRLQDPLAELVKIDPKSIGVGQYQHDVNQSLLRRSLEREVQSCVNSVGVDVNTASSSLLAHVAGIGPKLAERLVEYRDSTDVSITGSNSWMSRSWVARCFNRQPASCGFATAASPWTTQPFTRRAMAWWKRWRPD